MAERINIPRQDIPPGSYSHEIVAPTRASSAKLTMTRQPLGWPVGTVFSYQIYERERTLGALNLLTSGTEPGGTAIGKDGTVNPPFSRSFTWAADKDRDILRFDFTVAQTFNTEITLEFI